MRVEYLSRFSRDIDKLPSTFVRKSVLKVIIKVEEEKSLSEIPNVKKLTGHKSAYRIRVGDYRIGIFVNRELVQFGRVLHRKDIYKVFP